MKTEPFSLNEALHSEAIRHFSLLSNYHAKSGKATVDVNVRGYNGGLHLVADIIRTAIMALESETEHLDAPEPNRHIASVLAIALDLLPYEETDLLDKLYRRVHETKTDGAANEALANMFSQEREGNYSTTRIVGKGRKKSPFLTVPVN